MFYIPSKMDRLTISPTICVMRCLISPCWSWCITPPKNQCARPICKIHRPHWQLAISIKHCKTTQCGSGWCWSSRIWKPAVIYMADFQVQGVKRWPKEWSTPLSDKGSWWEVVKHWSLWHVDDHHLILYETTGVETSQEKFHHRLQEDNTGTAKSNMKVYRKSVKCPVVLLKHNNLDNQPDFTLIV